MMKTKTFKGLLSLLVSLAMAMTLSVSLFASAAEDAVTETVVVTQIIQTADEKTTYEFPQRTEYTYLLTPKRAENPMPKGTENGVYVVGPIWGESKDNFAPSFTLDIDLTKPGVYEYVLKAKEDVPTGDTLSPESHIFGYKVEVDEKTGELVAKPYICQSGQPSYFSDDKGGYPTKLTLVNTITGKEKTTTSTTTTTTKKGAASTRTVTTATRGGTTKAGTSTRARWVNTGDESQFILWAAVLGVALAGLIIIVILRRKKDDEEEDF